MAIALVSPRPDDPVPETVNHPIGDVGPISAVGTPGGPQDHDQFVGSRQCATCHAEISAAYETHPMANSMSRVTDLPLGSEEASRTVAGLTRQYKVMMRDGQMFHRESNNISHVTQTDHRILRQAVVESGTVRNGQVQLRFFDGAHQRMPKWEQNRAMGVAIWSYLSKKGQQSLEYVDRCLEIDSGHPGYHAIRADVLMNSGRLKEGITAGEKSLELDPTRIPVRAWLANAYEKDGRKADADAMRGIVRRMQTAKVPETNP